jgi:2-oxoglutarate dehydrogenase E2 component (dihydrolipoamide succinyltransferase)
MRIEIKIPSVGESITEVEIGEWFKKPGDTVAKNENLLLLETDKATVEIRAPESGTLSEVLKKNGESALIGEVVGHLETTTNGARAPARETEQRSAEPEPERDADASDAPPDREPSDVAEGRGASAPVPPSSSADGSVVQEPLRGESRDERDMESIGAKEMAAQDIQDAEPAQDRPAGAARDSEAEESLNEGAGATPASKADRRDEVVPMSVLRRRIAERLVAAQQHAAMLTTFNEIDMSAVIALRRDHGEAFQGRHRIKLGFMSFFIKAAVTALQSVREVNAEIKGDDIVYHNYCDIGVAVGGGKGLVVPVLRDAERMSFAEIERAIDGFAKRARENRLQPDELQGGTFTITNGGVYGSLFSTPIINPPQSAILGLHAIQDRPVARNGAVAVQPMMYVALTYDHRLIDGREAVLFLKQVKSMIEEPARMLLEF